MNMKIIELVAVSLVTAVVVLGGNEMYRSLNDQHTATDENGKILADGARSNGYRVNYHKNGIVRSEGMVKDGIPIGVWRTYDDTGNLVKEVNATITQYNPNRVKNEP
jgi:antitoxin component YwqK of YwqJK toxin-antitoxin module